MEVSRGRRMLMVLPSNITSQREDGIEAGRMLKEILASPANADKRQALCLWPYNFMWQRLAPELLSVLYEGGRTCINLILIKFVLSPYREMCVFHNAACLAARRNLGGSAAQVTANLHAYRITSCPCLSSCIVICHAMLCAR